MDKWLKSNTFVKIMSVGLAILLYIAVNDTPLGRQPANQTTATVIRNVALDAHIDGDRYVVVDMPQTVNLTLRGSSFLLNRVVVGNYRAYVDLTPYGTGVHRNVPVKVEGLPEGIDYVTEPSSVRVVIEEKQQKEVDVQIETVGQPAEGYTLGTPRVSPDRVLVRASEARLEDVELVKAVVNISGQTETIRETVELKAYSGAGDVLEDVEVVEPEADVKVPIVSPSTEVPLRPQVKEFPADGYSIHNLAVKDNRFTVYGDKDVIDQLDVYPGPALDLSGVSKDRTFEVKIPLIEGVNRVEPETVTIDVDVRRAERKVFENIPVKVRGLPDDKQADVVSDKDGTVSVTLEGSPERLNEVDRRDVEAYVDVSDLKSGVHEVEVQFDLPPFIQAVETASIQIELKNDT